MGPCGVMRDTVRFFEKNILPQKRDKNGVFEFIGKFSHYFFLKFLIIYSL